MLVRQASHYCNDAAAIAINSALAGAPALVNSSIADSSASASMVSSSLNNFSIHYKN